MRGRSRVKQILLILVMVLIAVALLAGSVLPPT